MRVIKGTFAVSTEYTMKAIIEDGTGSISARLSHEVCESIGECSLTRKGHRGTDGDID